MNSRDGLLLWVLGGAGILFLYAAWSKQHPADVLGKTLGTKPTAPDVPAGSAPPVHGGPATVQPAAAFTSRLPVPVPDAYATVPQLHIPGTWNA